MNFSDLFAPITEAYLTEDAMMGGDPNLLEIRFQLERDISLEDPEFIKISAMSANDASSQNLSVNVSDGLLISSE